MRTRVTAAKHTKSKSNEVIKTLRIFFRWSAATAIVVRDGEVRGTLKGQDERERKEDRKKRVNRRGLIKHEEQKWNEG